MKVLSKTLTTAFKSSLMASILFVLGVFGFNVAHIFLDIIPAFFIIWIITFIISTVAIQITILPFYYFSINNSLDIIFKRYFPYYAMLFFTLCLFLCIKVDFKAGSLIFGITYLTAMFAWIWFFKPKKHEK